MPAMQAVRLVGAGGGAGVLLRLGVEVRVKVRPPLPAPHLDACLPFAGHPDLHHVPGIQGEMLVPTLLRGHELNVV